MSRVNVEQAYAIAKERYAEMGVDVEGAMARLKGMPISLQCWQGDDVGGFERAMAGAPGGGLAATGNYPGKARNVEELRRDLEQALRMVPGRQRVNLHACYLENGGKFVDRDEVGVEHFQGWIDWAKGLKIGLDFNPTFFAHEKAADGFTLSHADKGIRKFWIEHGKASRRVAAEMGRQLGSASVNNVWVPDGYKDQPADRVGPRARLAEALDEVFAEEFKKGVLRDSVEGKLFGIGSESYVAGSHDFYLGYAITRKKLLCLDTGHFHPTESVADKISAVLEYLDEILLHVSRGVRWDSDHVVITGDELLGIAQEIVRNGFEKRVHVGLDYFDASINRVAAWVIGSRCTLRALLEAMLEPTETLRRMEREGDFTGRLAMMQEMKGMSAGAVWDHYCMREGAPVGAEWLEEVRRYEKETLAERT